MTLISRIFNLTLLLVLLAACEQSPPPVSGPVYNTGKTNSVQAFQLAIYPPHNPRKLTESYQPLIDYLNQHIANALFELEASRDSTAKQLIVIWETPSLMNNSVLVREDLPAAMADQVSELIHGLHDSDTDRAILSGKV